MPFLMECEAESKNINTFLSKLIQKCMFFGLMFFNNELETKLANRSLLPFYLIFCLVRFGRIAEVTIKGAQ
jgi:hypothetical protein